MKKNRGLMRGLGWIPWILERLMHKLRATFKGIIFEKREDLKKFFPSYFLISLWANNDRTLKTLKSATKIMCNNLKNLEFRKTKDWKKDVFYFFFRLFFNIILRNSNFKCIPWILQCLMSKMETLELMEQLS